MAQVGSCSQRIVNQFTRLSRIHSLASSSLKVIRAARKRSAPRMARPTTLASTPRGLAMTLASTKRAFVEGLGFIFAGIIVVEGWLWKQGNIAIQRLARETSFVSFEARLRKSIADLSPLVTLAAYLAPAALLLPILQSGVNLLSEGAILTGAIVFFISQTLLIAISAYLFELCRNKLFQISWVAPCCERVFRTHAWATAYVSPVLLRRREIWASIKSEFRTAYNEAKIVLTQKWASLRSAVETKSKLS